ncbi:MAG: 6-carboxytetrahydropterin synthase [Acidobacteriota bacterium]|nr:6-carboxytetrahydropterin synthase [Acidobacteriota bacterium]|tara:strand:- start:4859 stop:5266 length:408 start_codon:yes stop_codon:yes gene_type:complete
MYEVRVEANFEAGHKRGPDGEIHSLHHHAWKVAAYARSHDLDHIGLVIDFRVLRTVVDEVLGMLDQRVLEDVEGFSESGPTVPAVAAWIFERLDGRMRTITGGENGTEPDGTHDFWLAAVEVEADPGIRFEYRLD